MICRFGLSADFCPEPDYNPHQSLPPRASLGGLCLSHTLLQIISRPIAPPGSGSLSIVIATCGSILRRPILYGLTSRDLVFQDPTRTNALNMWANHIETGKITLSARKPPPTRTVGRLSVGFPSGPVRNGPYEGAISRACEEFLWFDDFHDRGIPRIGLDIQDVDSRRADAGHNQVASLDMRMRGIGTKRRTAGVPAKMRIESLREWYFRGTTAFGAR